MVIQNIVSTENDCLQPLLTRNEGNCVGHSFERVWRQLVAFVDIITTVEPGMVLRRVSLPGERAHAMADIQTK